MKVNDTTLNQAAASQLGKAQQVQQAPLEGKKGSGASGRLDADRVQLSDLSGHLVRMLSADFPERAARVEKLAAQFKAGRYPPDPVATSQALVADAVSHGS